MPLATGSRQLTQMGESGKPVCHLSSIPSVSCTDHPQRNHMGHLLQGQTLKPKTHQVAISNLTAQVFALTLPQKLMDFHPISNPSPQLPLEHHLTLSS